MQFIGTAAPGNGTKSMGAGKTVDGGPLSPSEDKPEPQGAMLGSGDKPGKTGTL